MTHIPSEAMMKNNRSKFIVVQLKIYLDIKFKLNFKQIRIKINFFNYFTPVRLTLLKKFKNKIFFF